MDIGKERRVIEIEPEPLVVPAEPAPPLPAPDLLPSQPDPIREPAFVPAER